MSTRLLSPLRNVRALSRTVALCALSLVAGGTFAAPPVETKSAPLSSYTLQPMDLIKVVVFQEPDMDRELRISGEQTISLPLIGRVDLRNRTVRDAEVLISELYQKDFLVSPQINVTVLEYSQRTVNVLGAVNTPGAVLIPPERVFTVLDAITRSGGFARIANRGRVNLARIMPDGLTKNYTIDVDQLMVGDGPHRWPVQNGDSIFVPERML